MRAGGGFDQDVARLVAEERLVEAAELAAARGDAHGASELYERACRFELGAAQALRAGEDDRAALLAAASGDERLAAEAVDRLAARGDKALAGRTAGQLELRGYPLWAARVYERTGDDEAAARAYERGGDALRAATILERSGEPVLAAKALETAARRDPDRYELHVALGALLLRFGKTEAALGALQKVPAEAAQRRAALTYLAVALERIGLKDASREASEELAKLGGPIADASFQAAEAKTRLFGRYDVEREVASTPSARVLRCHDAIRGEEVAIKIFAAYDSQGAGRDALARFEREVRALGAIEHPNVVPLRDYIPEGPALVLAWMGGGTLEQRIQEGSTAPQRAVEIACSVLAALGEAHRLGILHRDIKPANVLFDEAGAARLGDFGVAHLGDLTQTATAGVFGTLAYMSPEQREGRPASIQSDLYGVGVLLLEVLTGEKPGPGEAPRVLPSAAHRELDSRHDAVVLHFLEQDPAARPADAFAARRELLSLHWPSDIQPAPFAKANPRAAPASIRPATERFEHGDDGAVFDRLLEREVVWLEMNDATLARAAAFASAAHPALQTVLRVDREGGRIWLDAARGTPVARGLTADEANEVRAALEALHAAGAVHGGVSRNLVVTKAGLVLLFTAGAEASLTAEDDLRALEELAR